MRHCVSVLLAGGVTLILFALMQGFVAPRPAIALPQAELHVDFSMPIERTDIQTIRPAINPLKSMPKVKFPPPISRPDFTVERVGMPAQSHIAAMIGFDGNNLLATIDSSVPSAHQSTAPNASIVIEPVYPEKARRANVEGEVTLIFDISETGRAHNIRVAEARPEGYFERAAVQALKRWRFNQGKSLTGQRLTLHFSLDEAQ